MPKYELGLSMKTEVANAGMDMQGVDRFFRRLNRWGVRRIDKVISGFQERRDRIYVEAQKEENGDLRISDPFESWKRLGILSQLAEDVKTRKVAHQKTKAGIAKLTERIAS